jgi:hypothetical protein
MSLNTDSSLETTVKELSNKFLPKVILVNHEKELDVDTQVANIAIKYNMVYVSAYQIIKHHILHKTPMGLRLIASKKEKHLKLAPGISDRFSENEFSPVHFDTQMVCELVRNTINEKRQNQKFVLVEGMCNATKLADVDDKMQIRFMDELFSIEQCIGEVAAVISL